SRPPQGEGDPDALAPAVGVAPYDGGAAEAVGEFGDGGEAARAAARCRGEQARPVGVAVVHGEDGAVRARGVDHGGLRGDGGGVPDAVGDQFAEDEQRGTDGRVVPVDPPFRQRPFGGLAGDPDGGRLRREGQHVPVREGGRREGRRHGVSRAAACVAAEVGAGRPGGGVTGAGPAPPSGGNTPVRCRRSRAARIASGVVAYSPSPCPSRSRSRTPTESRTWRCSARIPETMTTMPRRASFSMASFRTRAPVASTTLTWDMRR